MNVQIFLKNIVFILFSFSVILFSLPCNVHVCRNRHLYKHLFKRFTVQRFALPCRSHFDCCFTSASSSELVAARMSEELSPSNRAVQIIYNSSSCGHFLHTQFNAPTFQDNSPCILRCGKYFLRANICSTLSGVKNCSAWSSVSITEQKRPSTMSAMGPVAWTLRRSCNNQCVG